MGYDRKLCADVLDAFIVSLRRWLSRRARCQCPGVQGHSTLAAHATEGPAGGQPQSAIPQSRNPAIPQSRKRR
ncbi:hypothetical protein, partial [Enhygromyxa salina]|uniref:hypothetical protein n=1 Tax=Enhygromyxa salina TaxID=215803 RepID=UPI001969DD83